MSSGSKTPSDSPPAGPKTPGNRAAKGAESGPDPRQERLAKALRDNLRKRKTQQRERKDGQRGPKDGTT